MEGIVQSLQAKQLQRTGLPMDGFGVLDEKKRIFCQQELNSYDGRSIDLCVCYDRESLHIVHQPCLAIRALTLNPIAEYL
jgi:hypothetical protein